MELGRNIAYYREQKGLTQTELAWATGVSEDYIIRVEKGIKRPSLRLLAMIAEALEIELSELLKE